MRLQEQRVNDPLALTRSGTGNGSVRLVASGEIDIFNVDGVRATIESILSEPATRRLTLDLTDLRYIDSAGVSALIFGLRVGERHGTTFEVVNPSREVLRVLRILGLERVLAPAA